MLTQAFDGLVTNAPGRQVDDALQRTIVTTVGDQTHIGHGVLDFRTLEKALAAIDTVWHRSTQQRFLKHP